MRWVLRPLLADKRFKVCVLAGSFGFLLVILGMVLPFPWLTNVALWFGLPLFAFGLIAILGLAGLIVFKDYKRYHSES